MLENTLVIECSRGLTLEVARMLLGRLAYLDAAVTLEGVDLRVQGAPSFKAMRQLNRLDLRHGDEVRIVADGPDDELALAEIKHLLALSDPDMHGACEDAAQGPRGAESTTPGDGPYAYRTSKGGVHNLFALTRNSALPLERT